MKCEAMSTPDPDPWSSKRKHLPILLHLCKKLVLHVSETQAEEQGRQAGALGDALALDIAPGRGVVKVRSTFDKLPCINMYADIHEYTQMPFCRHAQRLHTNSIICYCQLSRPKKTPNYVLPFLSHSPLLSWGGRDYIPIH